MTLNVFIGAIFCFTGYICGMSSVKIETKNGFLKGFLYKTTEGKVVNAFLGIPYAKPPVGKFRFQNAAHVEDWEGTKEAVSFGSECCQIGLGLLEQNSVHTVGSEDCLYLNIYTPTLNSSELEVIFYIHGGAFTFGSGGTVSPDYIMERTDVVFVSFNYRLGPFGFLSSEDHVIPGNFGLQDQVLALKWVNSNIEHFGGDRTKITIAGFSAGGASVHYHYFSPLSKDLFQRGISQSGTALCPWALTENSREKAERLASFVGCPTNDMEQTLECLQDKPAEEILMHMKHFMPWVFNPFTPFGPVIENNTSENSFLTKHPYTLLKEGKVKDAPWLVSIATAEGLCPGASFLANPILLEELEENWNRIAPHLLDYNNTIPQDQLNLTSQQIRAFYLGDQSVRRNIVKFIQMISDRLFVVHIEKSVKMQASVTKHPVYFYVFAYEGRYRFAHLFCNCTENFGVGHGDDMLYLLNTVFSPSPLDSQDGKSMVDTMVSIWSNFTINGKPFHGQNGNWIPISQLNDDWKNITFTLISSSTSLQSKSVDSLGSHKFWDTIPFNEYTLQEAQTKSKDEL